MDTLSRDIVSKLPNSNPSVGEELSKTTLHAIIAEQKATIDFLQNTLAENKKRYQILKDEQSAQRAAWDTIQAGWPIENEQLRKNLEQAHTLISILSEEKQNIERTSEAKQIELSFKQNELQHRCEDLFRAVCELEFSLDCSRCKETRRKLALLKGHNDNLTVGSYYNFKKI